MRAHGARVGCCKEAVLVCGKPPGGVPGVLGALGGVSMRGVSMLVVPALVVPELEAPVFA